jgi:hypothetical protein
MDQYINFLSNILFNFSFGDSTSLYSLSLNWLIQHSWLSLIYLEIFNNENVYKKFFTFFYLIIIWVLLDIWLFKLWNRFHKKSIKQKYNTVYLIFFRYIPIIGIFWALISGYKSKNITKKAHIYILSGNLLFWLINIIIIQQLLLK